MHQGGSNSLSKLKNENEITDLLIGIPRYMVSDRGNFIQSVLDTD